MLESTEETTRGILPFFCTSGLQEEIEISKMLYCCGSGRYSQNCRVHQGYNVEVLTEFVALQRKELTISRRGLCILESVGIDSFGSPGPDTCHMSGKHWLATLPGRKGLAPETRPVYRLSR